MNTTRAALLFAAALLTAIPSYAQAPTTLRLSAGERTMESLAVWSGDFSQRAKLDFPEARDLTKGATIDAFNLDLSLRPGKFTPTLTVWSGDNDASIWEWTPYTLPTGMAYLIPFADFVPLDGWGADFTKITRVEFDAGLSAGGVLKELAAELKLDATLVADNQLTILQTNADGAANPGEKLRYTVTISNTGTVNATNVLLTDLPDAKVALQAGSVQTTSGTVNSGNTVGDSGVSVSIPLVGVAPCQPQVVLVRYEVLIDNPFLDVGGQVCDQASLNSPDAPFAVTNDPTTVAANDPTCVTVVLSPEAVHAADQNEDGVIELNELLRVIQFYNASLYGCQNETEDGYAPGVSNTSCPPHDSDYLSQDWMIELSELLRLVQFFNLQHYFYCPSALPASEDQFCGSA